MSNQSMGVVLFKVTGTATKAGRTDQNREYAEVVAAAESAGIPEAHIREVKPKSAFTRAMGNMLKGNTMDADFRDKAEDNESHVTFAFVARLPGFAFDATYVVRWLKESKDVVILKAPEGADHEAIKTAALGEIERVKGIMNSADINRIVERYLRSVCRRIMLRDGVYFVPSPHEESAAAIRTFYKALGVNYMSHTIGYSLEDAEAIQQAVVQDMVKKVEQVKAEIQKIKDGEAELSPRTASTRLGELQAALRHYQELASATQADLGDLLGAAGEAGKTIVDMSLTPEEIVQRSEAGGAYQLDPVALEFYKTSADYDDTAVQILQEKTYQESEALDPSEGVQTPDGASIIREVEETPAI